MTNNVETTKERIIYYLDIKNIKLSHFYAKTGIKRGILDSDKLKQAISDTSLAIILEHYPNINPEWLIRGIGNMECSIINESIVSDATKEYETKHISIIESQQRTIEKLTEIITKLTDEKLSK